MADLECLKFERLALVDQRLAEHLATHPVEVNGKQYSVAEGDYMDLLTAYVAYTFMSGLGQPVPLEWYAIDGVCHSCTQEEFSQILAAVIGAVLPAKQKQKAIRAQIVAAQSEEEVNTVEIEFE